MNTKILLNNQRTVNLVNFYYGLIHKKNKAHSNYPYSKTVSKKNLATDTIHC
jgi:hypothetical protein